MKHGNLNGVNKYNPLKDTKIKVPNFQSGFIKSKNFTF